MRIQRSRLLWREAYPQGLQVGGGITADNAMEFIDAGAAAVIVTNPTYLKTAG